MTKIGFYAGSFDPFTVGHLAIACKSLETYDQIIVGVGVNPSKKGLFSLEEREELIRKTVDDLIESYDNRNMNGKSFSIGEVNIIKKIKANPNIIKIMSYDGLTIDAAIRNKATTLVRGERLFGDTESENQLENMNNTLAEIRGVNIKTDRIMVPKPDLTYVSSSSCKTLCACKEYIAAEKFVTPSVHNALMGKYLHEEFKELGKHFGLDDNEIDIHYNKLVNHYTKDRYYHNLTHVAYGLNHINIFNNTEKKIPNLEALKVAQFFHDIVNNGEKDDEILSAKMADTFMKKANDKDREVVKKCIMATTHLKDTRLSLEEKIICDADLAIFGDNQNSGMYAQNVRKEYSRFDDAKYATGRVVVLEKFMNKEELFKTPYFKRFEQSSIDNLHRERGHWLGIKNDLANKIVQARVVRNNS